MTTQKINTNPLFDTHVTVRESDKYSQMAFVKFTRGYSASDASGVSEMMLSASELENLADIMTNAAKRIRNQQDARHSESSI